MRVPLAFFILLTLASGWIPAAWLWWHGADLGWEQDGTTAMILALLGLGPGLAAALVRLYSQTPLNLNRPSTTINRSGHLSQGNRLGPSTTINRSGHLSEGNRLGLTFGRHELLAWILFPCLAFAAAGVSVAIGAAEWDWAMYNVQQSLAQRGFTPWNPWPFHLYAGIGITLISILAGPLIWFIPAYIEEFAWRGWLYAAWEKLGFWKMSLLAGGLWWLWKAPLFWLGYQYPGHPYLGMLAGLGFALATSLLLTGLRAWSGALAAPAIARATLASSAMMPMALTDLYDPVVAHLSGACGLAVLGLALLWTGWAGFFRPGFGLGHEHRG